MTKDMHLIDTYQSNSVLFTVKARPIFQARVKPMTNQTYTDSMFVFNLTLANKLLQGSIIDVYLPEEVKMANKTAPSLVPYANMDKTSSSISLATDEYGVQFLRISNFNVNSTLQIGTQVEFGLNALKTPLSSQTSSSFKVYTKDSQLRLVNYVRNDMFVTQTVGKIMTNIGMSLDNGIVGAVAQHTLTFTSVVPLRQSDQIVIQYPD